MALDMSDSLGSPTDFEPYSHFTFQASTQLDFTFYSPPHDGGLRESPVPAAVFNASLSDDSPSLGLTGDASLDELLNLDDPMIPRKRDRGERIVWTPEEDEYLRAAVQLYGDKTEKWAKIAACVPGRTNKNCRKRWFHSLDPKLKKGAWTEEEDHLLRTGVQMFKGQWSKIAERIPGRTDDQCAKRWRESLDPLIDRAAWTSEDDILLLQRFEEFGSQWQKIALAFPGRPGLHCRNRWRKIQRSLNHMKRSSKRRSQLGITGDQALLISETQRLEALLDSHNDDLDSDMAQFSTAEDILLMQDAFLDEDFGSMDHNIVIDENGLALATVTAKNDQTEASEAMADDEKPYGCAVPDCQFVSSSPSLLFYHFKASHSGTTVEKPFRCTMPGCETRKRYKNINGLQYHVTHAKNKKSPGHSGGSGHSANAGGATSAAADGSESSVATRAVQSSIPDSSNVNMSPHGSASPVDNGLHIVLPTAAFDPSNMPLSNPPTPAEIQLQLHQSKKDQSLQHILPQLSHSAFAIPHCPSPLEGSSASSQTSSGASSPQIQRSIFQCPKPGCDQSYQQIGGLTAHMANSHGRRAMNMRSNDTMYGSEAMLIPQEDHDDFDMDMAEMTSRASSPMDTSNMLLLDDTLLHNQVDGLRNEQEHMSLDPGPVYQGQLADSSGPVNNAPYGMLSSKNAIFLNQMAGNLQQSRVHFGTHVNVSMQEPIMLPPASSVPVSTGSANISLFGGSSITIAPAGIAAAGDSGSSPASQSPKSAKAGQALRSAGPVRRFVCAAPGCQRSYASVGTLNNHIRQDHSEQYTSTSASATTGSSGSNTRSPGNSLASMEIPHSPLLTKEDGEVADNKPYKCLVPGCGKGYSNINGLKNHLLQTHGSTPKKSTAI
ncbi:hypothetical protein BGZ72_006333 [Mortierella alpina]|nr:hypothetical protein BGZ72_006333 [Mortierella alpina]